MLRQNWWKAIIELYPNSSAPILQIMFKINNKLLHSHKQTQYIFPELQNLCSHFARFADYQQQQDLADFYVIILEQIHIVLNNNTERLVDIDKVKQIDITETLQQYFIRRTTKYWLIMDNSVITQYQNIWTLQMMTCQYCEHRNCQQCSCKRTSFEISKSWLLHLNVAGTNPGINVCTLTSNGKPLRNFYFEIDDYTIVSENKWQELLTKILHMKYTFTAITFEDNVVTLVNDDTHAEQIFRIYITEAIQNANVHERKPMINHIHPSRNLQTFPPILTLFGAMTQCICLQNFSVKNGTYIPVSISRSIDINCNKLDHVLAMPYFYCLTESSDIAKDLWQSPYLQKVDKNKLNVYYSLNSAADTWTNFDNWSVVWNKGVNHFNANSINDLQAGAELVVITAEAFEPFHVCSHVYVCHVDFYNKSQFFVFHSGMKFINQ